MEKSEDGSAPYLGREEHLQPPAVLYRYYGISGDGLERLRGLIQNGDVYFSHANQFNDPHDCKIAPRFDGSDIKIRDYWRRSVTRKNLSARDHRKRIEELLRQSRTPAGRAALSKKLFATLDTLGMLCLSTLPNNTLMWAYYAESHRGVCIKFNMDLSLVGSAVQANYYPVGVKYADQYPEMQFYKTTDAERMIAILGTKSKAWEHEAEWRIVLQNRTGLIRFRPEFVTGVILGLNTAESTEESIRDWVSKRKPELELLRVQRKATSFDLEIVPA